jgi:hypothetical protein
MRTLWPSDAEEGQVMTDAEMLLVLNDFFRWSGGELPTSEGQILVYMEYSYPFEGFDEDEVAEYLRSEVISDGDDGGGEE